jgi:hypothetical protein
MRHYQITGVATITENGSIPTVSHGLEIRNAGTTTVKINGFWTLKPSETKFFGFDDIEAVLNQTFFITFSGEGDNVVEVAETRFNCFDYSPNNYQ